MTNWLIVLLGTAIVILICIPAVMIGWLVVQVVSGRRKYRASEAQKVARIVPGLGEFVSTDGDVWCGVVQGLRITISTWQEPPGEPQVDLVRATLTNLPARVDAARAHLAAHEDLSWLEGGAAAFEAYGIDVEATSEFVLRLTHPTDPDGVYWVKFVDGRPVQSGRDD